MRFTATFMERHFWMRGKKFFDPFRPQILLQLQIVKIVKLLKESHLKDQDFQCLFVHF